ncbi:MAG: 2-amino-4-deoxychorismate dehydrogenase [Syntrophus sp. PtaU1.Bin005]|jgi:multimeric flavodoxin WrbA|uniref:flavodoxin family protein n=1 Tax=Syntrophus sp. (in: bacteria) TaxID=48412 RepID=UPI0009CA1BF2|nr:MAG: 2-amino-4-deoxychorismate dehydrogenase [Syntrophus sp. PtaU1.Bin005]
MKILGLVGSVRKSGNSEILTKEALMGAEEEGAQVEILRLTDYRVEPCTGCAACLLQERDCVIKDDANFIFAKMAESDGIIVGVPCYILEATAIVKQLIDRGFAPMQQNTLRGKVGGVIVPYATRGWTQNAFQQTNTWMLAMGIHVVDQLLIHVQGLSEAPLIQDALEKSRNLGKQVVRAIQTGDTSFQGEEGICPICHDRNIRILKDMETVECPVCAVRGSLKIEDGKISVVFTPEAIARHRWTVENLQRHFSYHLKPSKDFFIKTKEQRKEMAQKYKDYLKKS